VKPRGPSTLSFHEVSAHLYGIIVEPLPHLAADLPNFLDDRVYLFVPHGGVVERLTHLPS
jgi:hypothetical protein